MNSTTGTPLRPLHDHGTLCFTGSKSISDLTTVFDFLVVPCPARISSVRSTFFSTYYHNAPVSHTIPIKSTPPSPSPSPDRKKKLTVSF